MNQTKTTLVHPGLFQSKYSLPPKCLPKAQRAVTSPRDEQVASRRGKRNTTRGRTPAERNWEYQHETSLLIITLVE